MVVVDLVVELERKLPVQLAMKLFPLIARDSG